MDEWNRLPNDEQPQQPNGGEPSHPQNNQSPVTPPTYSYGWNPTPYAPPPKKNGRGTAVGIIVSVVCVIIVGALIALWVIAQNLGTSGGSSADGADGTSQTAKTTSSRNTNDRLTLTIPEVDEVLEGLSTRQIVNDNLDSTVLLTIYSTTSSGSFGQSDSRQVTAGFASGFVLSEDGYIATNWHCVVNEDTNQPFAHVDVTMYDGTVYEDAELIGADSSTDLAIIRVNATGLKAVTLGNSEALQLGDRVIALGNAGGLGFSATQGIVSGLARDVYEDTGYAIQCLQVDAAINPGNSGGPLFNAAGQVVAINSAKIVADGYEGLGFSIPINEALTVFNELIENGYVTGRVALGVNGQSYDDGYYAGFLIYSLESDSPLNGTGVQKGDLITAIDGTEVEDYATLRSALSKHQVGDTVTLTLLRSSNRRVESFEVKVVLTEAKG